jgi:hypothetical protein
MSEIECVLCAEEFDGMDLDDDQIFWINQMHPAITNAMRGVDDGLHNRLASECSGAISEKSRQISAGRYAYHKQIVKRYGDLVRLGQMPMEQGAEMYRLAMENYDGIIKAAANGHMTEANEADMERGFVL